MSRSTRLRWFVAGVLAVVTAHWLDPWAVTGLALPSAGDRDWGRLLRVIGFAPTWGLVALILWLEGRGTDRSEAMTGAALAVVLAVAVGGLGSEVLKLLFRRLRPDDVFAGYQFRPFTERPFSTSGLGLPSGHTLVAFSGAGALSVRFPRLAAVFFTLAAGCGLTRVFANAHYLSDVTVSAFLGTWIGQWAAGRRFGGERR